MADPGHDLYKLDDVAHIIQVALTPVFLLSGIGTLLNVFATRLARVADQVDRIADKVASLDARQESGLRRQLGTLRIRSLALDLAVILGALGGAATCGAVVMLFVGAVGERTAATALFLLFGLAIVCTIGALTAFLVEMLIASAGLRARAEKSKDEARS